MHKLFLGLRCATRTAASGMNRAVLLIFLVLLTYQVAAAQSIKLAWDASTGNTLAGYKVYTGTSSGKYSSGVKVGNVLTYSTPTLAPGTYYVAVTAYDSAGLESPYSKEITVYLSSTSTTTSTTDTTPPVISSIAVSSITAAGATITWTTNEASDSQVEYGTSTAYGSATAINSTRVASHSQSITGLAAGTTYYFRVKSRDAAGNLAVSAGSQFKTASSGDTTAPTVSITSPASGSTVSGTVTASASASDNVGIGGVQFLLNGSPLGTEDTASPYSISWNSASFANGTYTLTASARDTSGNTRVSAGLTITIQNSGSSGLQAGFPLSEGTGSTSADMSGNGNTASLYSNVWDAGRFGSGLAFNGSTSYVRAGTRNLPAQNSAQTIAAYYFVSSNPSSAQVLLRSTNVTGHTDINIGFLSSRLGVWNQNQVWLVSATPPAPGTWHHVAYTFDGKYHKLYVDGALMSKSTVTPSSNATTELEFGRGSGSCAYFRGNLDEVRIYNRALSSLEISSLLASSLSSASTSALAPMAMSEAEPAAYQTMSVVESAQSVSLPLDNSDSSGTGPAASQSSPLVALELTKPSYSGEERVELSRFSVSNPTRSDRSVEMKTWLASSSFAPFNLGSNGEDGSLVLPAGVSAEFGPMTVLDRADDQPAGTQVGSRILDPVTGDTLSETAVSFSVSSETTARVAGMDPLLPASISVSAELSAPAYFSGDIISVADLSILNSGSNPAFVQVKLWIESRGMEPIPLMRAGADGYLMVPAGEELNFYRPRDLAVPTEMPRGGYALRCRVLDPVTGQILADRSVYFQVQ